MPKGKFVGVVEFARLIGVTRGAVDYAIKKGRIKSQQVGNKRMLDFEKAKKEWDENTDKAASKKGHAKKKIKSKVVNQEYVAKTYDGLTTSDAERQEKVYKARLAELKYKEQAGELAEVKKIKKEAFETGRKVRDAIMQIPARLSHEIAVETDPHKCEVMLAKELNQALVKLTKGES